VLDEPARLPAARLQLAAPAAGVRYVAEVNADAVGRACVALGAGRRRMEDAVDPAVA